MADEPNERERDQATEVLNIRFPAWLHAMMKSQSARQRVTVSHVARAAVEHYLTAPENRLDAEARVIDAQAEAQRWHELFDGLKEAFEQLQQQYHDLLALKSVSVNELIAVLTARLDEVERDADQMKLVVERQRYLIEEFNGNLGGFATNTEKRLEALEAAVDVGLDAELVEARKRGAAFLDSARRRHERAELDDLINASE